MKPIPSPHSLNATGDTSLAEKLAEKSELPHGQQNRVQCPTCHKSFIYGESKFRPFCSERCRMIDLGRWFKEEYKVAAEDQTPEDEDPSPKQDDDAAIE